VRRALIVGRDVSWPAITGGYARMVEYLAGGVFQGYDTWVLEGIGPRPVALHHGEETVAFYPSVDEVLALEPAFAFFFQSAADVGAPAFARIAREVPSFFFSQRHPPVPAALRLPFRGWVAHSAASPSPDLLVLGGAFDARVFFPDGGPREELVVSVARIAREKNQAALVAGYRERIWERHGLPLLLVGGNGDDAYWSTVSRWVDGVAVRSTVVEAGEGSYNGFLPSAEVAALCRRARFMVMPSERETFCLALVEAMACGATCVVNGWYPGFDPAELAPRVFGPVDGPRGSILDVLDAAVRAEVRIDASAWARERFSIPAIAARLMPFIEARLGPR
jgi:glycosyltransferase involved in cell wall biosynthesis